LSEEELNPVEFSKADLLYDLQYSDEFNFQSNLMRLFNFSLLLYEQNRYPEAREMFYDFVNWFQVIFDEYFVNRWDFIIEKYKSPDYNFYTTEQRQQIIYMRHLTEFCNLLSRASTQKSGVEYRTDNPVELIPIGFGAVFQYEHMTKSLYTTLLRIKMGAPDYQVHKLFRHSLGWYAGAFDAEFIWNCKQIENQAEQMDFTTDHEKEQFIHYRQVGQFSKLLARKGVYPLPKSKLVYKPRWDDSMVPHNVEDVIK